MDQTFEFSHCFIVDSRGNTHLFLLFGIFYTLSLIHIFHPVAEPISEQGGLAVLHGNIGTDSAIVKFSAVAESAWIFDGPAKCYDSQDDAWHAILKDEIEAGDVVVIRYEGPKGSPGMPHMETFMAAVLGLSLIHI